MSRMIPERRRPERPGPLAPVGVAGSEDMTARLLEEVRRLEKIDLDQVAKERTGK
jgi:hypothetical protein